MAISVVRLGSDRLPNEGLRLGTVRRPPRGVKKQDFAKRNYYDVWVPDLAPSAQLVSWALADDWTDERWKRYRKEYLKEMKAPERKRLLALLATMSRDSNFSIGCYCENASRCHRSILQELLEDAGAVMTSTR
jgi:uncharacterized protein YeaO (DUF488 family)